MLSICQINFCLRCNIPPISRTSNDFDDVDLFFFQVVSMVSINTGPLSGYSYATVGGPTHQPVNVVRFDGHIKHQIKLSMKEYGAVGPQPEGTNPHRTDSYKIFCNTSSSREEL